MLPLQLSTLWRSEVQMQSFMGRSLENARMAREEMAGIANSRKAYTGLIAGLQDPRLIERKAKAELELRQKVAADGEREEHWGDAWDAVGEAEEHYAEFFDRKYVIDRAVLPSGLLSRALHIVRLVDELPKANGDRLKEYTDAALESLYVNLYSPEPIVAPLETEVLAQSLSRLAEMFGGDDELVTDALAGKSPRERAKELVAGTKLSDPKNRRALVEAGAAAVKESTDPVIALARLIDGESRELRKMYEDTVESVERDAYAKIAAAQFWAYGDNTYPDATFTLRLAFGTIAGCPLAPKAFTDYAGMYQRHAERKGEGEFSLDKRWLDRKEKLNLSTPFNFTCTADIIGGNSGSPVVNAKGEVIGLIFDGNIDSLVGDVVYDDRNSRAVAVDSRGLIEALRAIYEATGLVDELTAK